MPTILGPLPGNAAERAVYRELERQLPRDWVVLSNVCWSERALGDGCTNWVRDGQADFVVIAPKRGMCILEVKGSKMIRISENGRWFRKERGRWVEISPKIPPEQAMSNAHQLAKLAAKRLLWGQFKYNFGYIVIYPNGSIVEGSLHTFDSTTVIERHQMGELSQRISTALAVRGGVANNSDLIFEVAREIGRCLMNAPLKIERLDAADPADTEADVHAIEQLTRQQHAALSGIFRHPRVAVTGPAGSGKTVLAMWRLAALVEQDKRCLFLCYNKQLALHLRMMNPDLAEHIAHVDSHFRRISGGRGPAPGADLEKYFSEILPGHVIDSLEGRPDESKLEALIIDEGQDFGELRLWAAQTLLREDGTFLYCSDDRQDLYDRETRTAVGAEVVFSLVHNCRNTVRIAETSSLALGESIRSMPGLPDGVPTIVRHCSDRRSMAKEAWKLIGEWGTDKRAAILSPYRLENSAMSESRTGYNKQLVTDLESWDVSRTVLFSTIRSFKGLEADVVVVVDVDVPEEDQFLTRNDLYVACTRAKARLGILTATEAGADLLDT